MGENHSISHDDFVHPNAEKSQDGASSTSNIKNPKKRNKCVQMFKDLDAVVIKPLLLYKYDKELHKKRQEFYNNYV